MPVNRYQHLGSSQAPLTPADGTLIEGPPTADITLIPKNLGDPCSRNYYVQFTWSEPVEFIDSIIFGSILESIIYSGTSFTSVSNPLGTDIFIFTDHSIGTLSDYQNEDGTTLSNAVKGEVAEYSSSNSKWIRKGNLLVSSIHSSQVTSLGNTLPTSPSGGDIFIFNMDASGLSNYQDRLDDPLTDAKKGDIASYYSVQMKWVRYGNLATNNLLIHPSDTDKVKLIPGTLRSNNPLVWTAEVEIIDPGDPDDLDNPGGIAGEFTIGVNPESARGILSETLGPPSGNITARSETFRYDFTDCIYPTVAIDIPADIDFEADVDEIYKGLKNIVYFIWTEPVSGFNSSDITITDENGSDVTGLEITTPESYGSSAIYISTITFPDGEGTAKITVKAYSAIGTSNPGPIQDISKSINYDTTMSRNCVVTDISGEDGEFSQVTTGDIAVEDNPYLDDALIYTGDHAGGYFNGVLELRKAGNFIFRVVQVAKQASGYLRNLEQAGVALVRININDFIEGDIVIDSEKFDIIKTYSDVALAARSLTLHDGYLYFMEGSHYIYHPRTVFRSNDLTIPRSFEYTDATLADLGTKQQTLTFLADVSSSEWKRNIGGVFRIDTSVDYKKGDVFQYASSGWGARSSNNLLSYSAISDIRNIYIDTEFIENPQKYDIFIFNATVSSGLTWKDTDLTDITDSEKGDIAQWDGDDWIKRGVLNNLIQIHADANTDFIVGNILPDTENIGDVFIFNSIVETVSDSNWRSATTEDEPVPEKDRDGNDILDYFYGVHGGTASPIVSDGDKLHLITGYGNLRQGLIRNARLSDSKIDINLLDNLQWVQYSDKLNHKISQILTNNKSPYALMSDISNMTNSIFGFSNEFFMKPRDPRKAKLGVDGISLSEILSIGLLSGSQNWNPTRYPPSSILLIEDELISYGDTAIGYSPNTATEGASLVGGITRGLHRTAASVHGAEAEVLWIDHYITHNMQRIERPIQTLNITSQSEHIYNDIKVMYGSDKVYELEDDDSIAANGRKLFEISTILDDHQYDWAKWIGDTFLERFKDIHHIVDMELKTTLYMNIGDIVLIEQQDRAHMFSPCQVLNITQNPPERSTTIKLITL